MITELTAVNAMLASIGEDPVSALDTTAPDAQVARAVLQEVSSEVQEVGWNVNTSALRAAPDISGAILLPANALRVKTVGYSQGRKVSMRLPPGSAQRKLWDVSKGTFAFTAPVYLEVVAELPFEALTPALASYIKAKAIRIYQSRRLGAANLDRMIVRDETEALARLQDDEDEQEDTNLLSDNYDLAWGRWHYGTR